MMLDYNIIMKNSNGAMKELLHQEADALFRLQLAETPFGALNTLREINKLFIEFKQISEYLDKLDVYQLTIADEYRRG